MPSTLAVATWRPALSQAHLTRAEAWPCRVARHSPVLTFHTLHCLSPEAETSSYSVGANWMSQIPLWWPFRVFLSVRELACQMLIVLSCEEVATSLSLGETRTALMYF